MIKHAIGAGALLALVVGQVQAITIEFDYSLDSTGFFSGANIGRRDALNTAATYFTPFTDQLSAITPSGSNSWTANTSLGSVTGPSIAANTVRVYIGASDITALGQGGYGGYGVSYIPDAAGLAFYNALTTRGQTNTSGAGATDFGKWGGGITFDSNLNTGYTWNFDVANGPSSTQYDFLSVAIHELAHVLGFGTGDSWQHYVSGTTFTGPTADGLYGGLPAVNAGLDHWDYGVSSFLPGSGLPQETSMDPDIANGQRKLFTALDYAAMKDIGWEVPANLLTTVPEPASMALLAIGGMMLLARRKR